MPADQSFTLQQLVRSYALQIEYVQLLSRLGVLEQDAAQAEVEIVCEKMDYAAERLCQLRLEEKAEWLTNGRAINPILIPDLQYI